MPSVRDKPTGRLNDILEVLFNLLCVIATVNVDFLHSSAGKELAGVFNQRRVGKGK